MKRCSDCRVAQRGLQLQGAHLPASLPTPALRLCRHRPGCPNPPRPHPPRPRPTLPPLHRPRERHRRQQAAEPLLLPPLVAAPLPAAALHRLVAAAALAVHAARRHRRSVPPGPPEALLHGTCSMRQWWLSDCTTAIKQCTRVLRKDYGICLMQVAVRRHALTWLGLRSRRPSFCLLASSGIAPSHLWTVATTPSSRRSSHHRSSFPRVSQSPRSLGVGRVHLSSTAGSSHQAPLHLRRLSA